MAYNICIITQSHLCRNPRVLKEATALAKAGYNIQILTGIISTDLHTQDLEAIKDYPAITLLPIVNLSATTLLSLTDKLLSKLGKALVSKFRIENSLALGYGAARYYNKAKAVKADLYICHQELATHIGTKLLSAGCKVAFDLEDWYSEDLLPEARSERPINLLRQAEAIALKQGTFCITTSNALAQKLSQVYNSTPPQVIYNVFPSPVISNKPKEFTNPLKLFWFSQTVGSGRGLERFIGLLAAFKNKLQLHLLGNITEHYRGELTALLPKQHELYFHNLVSENQLAQKIAEFDIGLALELNVPMSRNYTITNKFFQYIQSALPVIASETDGQNEAFEPFKPGFKLSQKPTGAEIATLENWLNNTAALQVARHRAGEAAAVYNWENESNKLLALVKTALEK